MNICSGEWGECVSIMCLCVCVCLCRLYNNIILGITPDNQCPSKAV